MATTLEQGQALASARRADAPLVAKPGDAPLDEARAYAVQAEAVAAYGGVRNGYKIGATSQGAQTLLGIDHPFEAPMFVGDSHSEGATIQLPQCGSVGIEAEFALRLGSDLGPRPEPYSIDEVRAAAATVHPAFEIIGLRVPAAQFANVLVVIADFGGNAGFIAGAGVTDWRDHDLATIAVDVEMNGERVATGSGAAAMGNPLNALLWLAEHRRAAGEGLVAGEYVSTGTCTGGLIPMDAGQTAVADFGPFGSVTMSLSVNE